MLIFNLQPATLIHNSLYIQSILHRIALFLLNIEHRIKKNLNRIINYGTNCFTGTKNIDQIFIFT